MQGIRRALRMQADVGRELGQDVVAREEQPVRRFIKADVPRRVAGRPLDAKVASPHLDGLGTVELYRGVCGLHDLAQRSLRVAEHLGLVGRHAVDEQVVPHLLDQVLELDIPRMDERDFEAVTACEASRRAVMVGMDVRHHQATQALHTEMFEGPVDRLERFVGVHAAVEQVRLFAVGEDEHVDQAVFERDGETQLENARRDLGKGYVKRHSGIVVDRAKMGFRSSLRLRGRSRCLTSR